MLVYKGDMKNIKGWLVELGIEYIRNSSSFFKKNQKKKTRMYINLNLIRQPLNLISIITVVCDIGTSIWKAVKDSN